VRHFFFSIRILLSLHVRGRTPTDVGANNKLEVDNYIRRGDIVGFNRFSGLVSNPDAPERGLGPPSLSTPVSQPSYMLPTGRPPPSLGSGISSGTYSHGTSGLP
jgi:hypothetical protein